MISPGFFLKINNTVFVVEPKQTLKRNSTGKLHRNKKSVQCAVKNIGFSAAVNNIQISDHKIEIFGKKVY